MKRRPRRRTRPQPRASLPDREALVLGALFFFGERGCYGVQVGEYIAKTHHVSVGPGSLYKMLGRLVVKRLAKRIDEAESLHAEEGYVPDEAADNREQQRRRAGRRQFYRITSHGKAALRAKVELLAPLVTLWSGSEPD